MNYNKTYKKFIYDTYVFHSLVLILKTHFPEINTKIKTPKQYNPKVYNISEENISAEADALAVRPINCLLFSMVIKITTVINCKQVYPDSIR